MDVRAHLDSYRDSLRKDALDGCVDYSKAIATANPSKYPTVFDYLKYTLEAARYHAENFDPTSYKLWLPKHQEAMVLLFERMVDEILFGAEDATLDVVVSLIEEKGWNWFKFGQKAITYKLTMTDQTSLDVTVVPRFVGKWVRPGKQGEVIFDCDELTTLIASRDKDLATMVVEKKKIEECKFLGMTLVERKPVAMFKPYAHTNGDRVMDWSLPLWGNK